MEGIEKVHKTDVEGIPHDTIIGASIFRTNADGKQEVLLVQGPSGKWYFPGGKMREGENMEDCLRREIKEELNVDYEGRFSKFNIGSYEIKGKQLVIVNVTALDYFPENIYKPHESDAVRRVEWTSEPLNYDLTEQARVVLANQMSNTTLPKPEK